MTLVLVPNVILFLSHLKLLWRVVSGNPVETRFLQLPSQLGVIAERVHASLLGSQSRRRLQRLTAHRSGGDAAQKNV